MQIRLRNEIQLDGQMEVVDQSYPVEATSKNGHLYLIFTNEEKEKTVIKCDADELVMTRFSNPKSIMPLCQKKSPLLLSIPRLASNTL